MNNGPWNRQREQLIPDRVSNRWISRVDYNPPSMIDVQELGYLGWRIARMQEPGD